jgi:polysaccharide biosynthesis transport protein
MSSAASAQPAETGTTFRWDDLVRVARERRALIQIVAVAVVALTVAVLYALPTLYSTSASVMLDPRKNNVADLSSVLSQLPTDPSSLQNQIQILNSRDLAQEVIAKLKLYDDPEFNTSLQQSGIGALLAAIDPRNWFAQTGGDDAVAEREKIVNAFLADLSVEAQGLSTTLTVRFISRDPQKAALVANTLVDTYIDDQVQAKREIGEKTTDWLVTRTRELAAQLQAQEAAVQRYKADNNITEAADGTSLADQQITAISNQLVLARVDLAQKEATGNRVAALIKAGDTADVSQILASPLIVQLRTQQAQLIAQEADLATRYGPRHPKYEAVQTQKRDLDSKIETEVNRAAGSISNDVVVSRAQVASLQSSLSAAEKQASAQNLVRVKLRALQSNAQSTRTMYEAFVTRLRETQDQDVIQSPDARVVSRAAIPAVPSSPKRMLIAAASIPTGLLLGLLAALLAERFAAPMPVRAQPATTLRSMPAPVLRGPPVLAEIAGALDPRAADFVIDWPHSGFAHEIAALLRRVRWQGAKIIAVTGSDTGRAKTSLAVSLARTAARGGLRVAMIDGDLQQSAATRAMGLGPIRFGLVELLKGTVPLSRAFCRDTRSPALVLSSSHPLRNPDVVLASAKMAELVAHLRRTCDVVIIDAPSLLAGPQTQALARLADALLVVARTDMQPPVQALTSLANRVSAATGVVLVR